MFKAFTHCLHCFQAVIIIVVLVLVVLLAGLTLLYYKRKVVTDYIQERRKSQSGQQFDLINTKLTANPDFMARLAPQWPEPEPADPGEGQAFIVQQVGRAYAGSHSTVSTQQIYYL